VLVEYQKAPAVTRDRMYLDTMQQIFANTTKVMVDARTGNNLLYLPLDKLISQAAAIEATNARGAAPAQGPVGSSGGTGTDSLQSVETQRQRDSRTRDARDSREREGR
jgi:membrane protease subunit HflK